MGVGDSASLITLDKALREVYPENAIRFQLYEKNPLFAAMRKTKFSGSTEEIPVRTAGQQGRSADFARAQTNRSTSVNKRFAVTTVKDYAVGRINSEALYAEQDRRGSLVAKASDELATSMIAMERSLAVGVWGNGGGAIGQIAAYAAGPPAVITLADSRTIVNFEEGQVLQVAITDGTSGAVQAGRLRVDKINRNSNTVEVTNGGFNGEAPVAPDPAVGDFIFVDGDFGQKVSGIRAWIPDTDPTTGDSFFGVDRSSDPLRLAGIRYNAIGGQSIRETLRSALTHALVNNARPDCIFMHPEAYNTFINSLAGQERYDMIKASDNAKISFQAITFTGPYGPVKIVPDANCPYARSYALSLKSWSYASRNMGPDFLKFGQYNTSQPMLTRFAEASDEVEWRIGSFAQIECNAPGHNVSIGLGISL